MKFITKYYPIILVFIFAILASLPLFQQGFFTMHDDEQIARLYDLDQALAEGQFPPRLAPNLGYGYGYPFFNYYPSFAYYVGEVFHIVGFSYIASTKLMLFVGFLLAAYFSYLLAKELFGKEAGLIAAAAYTFAPYHAVDIYVRGAFAEFFSFVFIPLIFYSTYKLFQTKIIIYAVLIALSVAGLILSHNLIALMSTPFIAIWLAYLLIKSDRRANFLKWTTLGFALGFGLSAYFFVPSFLERDMTLIKILTSELASYDLHFVCIPQLFHSMWGYGGSIASCQDGLSLEVGKVHLLLAAFATITFIYSLMKNKVKREFSPIPIFAGMLLLSMFLMVNDSKIVWDLFSPLWYIQFPWRFLTIAVFASSILAGSTILFIHDKRLRPAFLILVVGFLVVFNIRFFEPREHNNAKDNYYIEKIRWETSNLAYEYVPENIKTKKSDRGTTVIDINESEIKTSSYSVVNGQMEVKVEKDAAHEKRFRIHTTTGGIFRINTFRIPEWQVSLDGKVVPHRQSWKLVLIEIEVPKGEHTVHAVYKNTPVRSLANMTTIVSIIGICGVIYYTRKHEKA